MQNLKELVEKRRTELREEPIKKSLSEKLIEMGFLSQNNYRFDIPKSLSENLILKIYLNNFRIECEYDFKDSNGSWQSNDCLKEDFNYYENSFSDIENLIVGIIEKAYFV